jgi:hypothetical protein
VAPWIRGASFWLAPKPTGLLNNKIKSPTNKPIARFLRTGEAVGLAFPEGAGVKSPVAAFLFFFLKK